jgi:hypothetical protein
MDRATLVQLWDDWWTGDIWIVPWGKALEGLTAAQAAWTPKAKRHSIWQNVNHIVFWREYTLDRLATPPKPKPAAEDIERLQFAAPAKVTEEAWSDTRERLQQTHRRVRDAIADPQMPLDRLKYHLAHDAYHLGQIMYLRALQGLPKVL